MLLRYIEDASKNITVRRAGARSRNTVPVVVAKNFTICCAEDGEDVEELPYYVSLTLHAGICTQYVRCTW